MTHRSEPITPATRARGPGRSTTGVRLRPATLRDAWFLFRLRNSEDVRAVSLSNEELRYGQHYEWLQRQIESGRTFFVILCDGRRAGYVRVSDKRVLSIAIVAEARGQGVGRRALEECRRRCGPTRAYVLADNMASMSLFRSVGYAEKERGSWGVRTFVEMENA